MTNRIEHRLELTIVLSLELVELLGEISMHACNAAQLHEGTHDFDVHRDGTVTSKNRGQHRNALFGEDI